MSKIQNVNDALSVLIQAVELGRKSGIYNWDDLELISDTLKFLKSQGQEVPEKDVTEEANIDAQEAPITEE